MEAHAPSSQHPLLTQGKSLRRRNRTNRVVEVISSTAALLAVALLAVVIGSVAAHGLSSISLDFLTKSGAGQTFGAAGEGIANSIVGTALLIGIASVIAIPVGIGVAIYTSEFAGSRFGNVIRFGLDILNGVPTIVTGIFVFGLLVSGGHQSGVAGGIALSIIMLPIVARTGQEMLALVPSSLKEAGYALGMARWRVVLRIVLPTVFGGLLTGSLLAVARVAGETAPLLFVCSIPPATLSTDVSQPLASIPVTIFGLSEQPSPAAHEQAWAAALVLILFVLLLNIAARALHARSTRRLKP
jgi:phosphate transport system permease protein